MVQRNTTLAVLIWPTIVLGVLFETLTVLPIYVSLPLAVAEFAAMQYVRSPARQGANLRWRSKSSCHTNRSTCAWHRLLTSRRSSSAVCFGYSIAGPLVCCEVSFRPRVALTHKARPDTPSPIWGFSSASCYAPSTSIEQFGQIPALYRSRLATRKSRW